MFTQLDDRLVQAFKDAGFERPTRVQIETLEAALDGDDLFVCAQTGSGKTGAYLLPTLERLLAYEDKPAIRALVLVPTRELAQQVLKHAKLFARLTPLKLGHIGGGTDIHKQTEIIQSPPHFLVATPGRLSELLARELLDLSQVNTLILDEADRLLDMGFSDEIMAIASHCSQREQTQLYSATLANKQLRKFGDDLLSDPKVITLNKISDKHQSIKQQIVFADDKAHKLKLLCWLLDNENYRRCLVFCNTIEQVDQLNSQFQKLNATREEEIKIGTLHGSCDQKKRNLVMSKFRRDQLKVVLATDIAARGLDVEGLDLVINFDMPRLGEHYLHRVGRTGRAGESGLAISLIMAPEYNLMSGIERYLKQKFERRKIKPLEGHYKGPKKLKSSGKAAGSKKKKQKKKNAKTGSRPGAVKKSGKHS